MSQEVILEMLLQCGVFGDSTVPGEAAGMARYRCGQTFGSGEGTTPEYPGNVCHLFSSSDGSLYPKGHCSSALSPESAELITHAQRYYKQTTKGSQTSLTSITCPG